MGLPRGVIIGGACAVELIELEPRLSNDDIDTEEDEDWEEACDDERDGGEYVIWEMLQLLANVKPPWPL